ncbi:MAG: sodium:solute symporter family transporter, partial [bacterium]
GAIAAQGATVLNNLSFALGFLVVLLFMAEKLRAFGGFTLPDFPRGSVRVKQLQSFCGIGCTGVGHSILIAQTKSMGLVVQQMSGLSPSVSLILATAIFVFYTSIGGMLAAVWTDIAQWLFMTVGLGSLLVVLWGELGGLTGMALAAEKAAPGWTSLTGIGWTQTGFWTWHLVWFIAYFTRIEFVTKMYTAKDERTAKASVAWGLLLVLIFFSITVFYGGAARALVWDQLRTPDEAFPVLVKTYLSPLWASLALAGVAAAAMSTVSSLLLLSGAAIAHDLLRKCLLRTAGH